MGAIRSIKFNWSKSKFEQTEAFKLQIYSTKGNINLYKWVCMRKKHFIRVWPKQTDKIHAQLHATFVCMAGE
jgi:hypothetical protein